MRVACLMMQKNEQSLLDQWISHHGEMFGYSSLYVFDNGSHFPETLDLLIKSEKKGANIIRKYNTAADFEKKGDIFGDLIKSFSKFEMYDIYIPLDADEFLGLHKHENNISFVRDDIFAELEKHIDPEYVPFIYGSFYNIPSSRSFYFRQERKCFFGRKNFGSLDIGFHWGKASNPNFTEFRTQIDHVHFQKKPFILQKYHAAEKLKKRVSSFDPLYLKTYTGPGAHLARYFFISEQEYLDEFKKVGEICNLPNLERQLEKLGVPFPYENIYNMNAVTDDLDRKSVV